MTDIHEPDRAFPDDPTTATDESFVDEPPIGESVTPEGDGEPVEDTQPIGAPMQTGPSAWFSPTVRKALYGVSMACVPLLVALGISTEQVWVLVAGVIDSVFALLVATLHTNSVRSEQTSVKFTIMGR